MLSTTEDEIESYGEISRFDNKKLDHGMIMNWPVTSKPYSICGEHEKTRSRRKSDFRNKLKLMLPLKPKNIPPTDLRFV